MPFGFRIAPDTLPSGTQATGSRSALAVSGFRLCARLGFSILPGQRGITPAFGYGPPHPSAEGTSTPMIHALPSAHYKPLRHPMSAQPLPHGRLVGTTLWGFPCCARLPSCACCRHYPGAAAGRRPRSSHPAVTAFPDNVVGSTCTSSFSRLAQRSLALRPAHSRGHLYVTRYTEGFSHFVTSMTTPVASGWSVRRAGLSPTGKRRLLTAHANSGRCGTAWRTGQINPKADLKPSALSGSRIVAGARQRRRGRSSSFH